MNLDQNSLKIEVQGLSLKKKVLLALLPILGIVLTFIMLLPSLLSTSWVKDRFLVPYVNRHIQGQIEVKNLQLSWFGKQSLGGFVLRDIDQKNLVTIESLETDTSLWHLLYKRPHLGTLHLEGLDLFLEQDEQGISNFQRVLDKSRAPRSEKGAFDLITLSQIHATIRLPVEKKPLEIRLAGKTLHAETNGNFDFFCTISGVDWNSLLKKPFEQFLKNDFQNARVNLNVDVNHFPIEVLDRALALKWPEAKGSINHLLGQYLDVHARQAEEHENGEALNIDIKSEHLKGQLNGRMTHQNISFDSKSYLNFEIDPNFFAWAQEHVPFFDANTANQKTSLVVQLDRFNFSFFAGAEQKQDFRISAFLDQLPLTKDLSLKAVFGFIETPKDESQIISFGMHADVLSMGHQGSFSMQGHEDVQAGLVSSEDVHLLLQARQLPSQIGSLWYADDAFWKVAVGATFDVDMEVTGKESHWLGQASLKSERVQSDLLKFEMLGTKGTLISPAQVRVRLSPKLFTLSSAGESLELLKSETPIVLQLSQLHWNLPVRKEAHPFFSLRAGAQIDSISFQNLPKVQSFELKDLLAKIEGRSDENWSFTLTTKGSSALPSPLQLLGQGDFQVTTHAYFKLPSHNKPLIVTDMHFDLLSSGSQFHLEGNVTPDEESTFHGSGGGHFTFNADDLEFADIPLKQLNFVHTPSSFRLLVDEIQFSLSAFESQSVIAKGRAELDQLEWHDSSHSTATTALRHLKMPWSFNGTKDQLHIQLEGNSVFTAENQTGHLSGELKVQGIASSPSKPQMWKSELHTQLNQAPLALLETALGLENITPLFGKKCDIGLNAKFDLAKHQDGILMLDVKGENWALNGGLRVGKEIALLDFEEPLKFAWTLSPERFAFIRHLLKSYDNREHHLILNRAAQIEILLADLYIPMRTTPEQKYRAVDLKRTRLNLRGSIDSLSLADAATGEASLFENVSAQIQTEDLSDGLQLKLFAKGHVGELRRIDSEPTELNMSALFQNLWKKDGSLNLYGLSLTLDAKTTKAPVILLCNLGCFGDSMLNQTEALLGHYLNSTIQVRLNELQGPIKIILRGDRGSLDLDGLIQNDYLVLSKPLEIQTTVSPELSKTVLQDLIPFLSTATHADQPARIAIDPQGFSIPLLEWDLQKVSFDTAMIDLGKVYFSNEGQLGQLLDVLNFNVTKHKALNVWFTPLYASLHSGEVNIERMDMLLVSSYPIAIWGVVNFPNDRVNLTVGLSGPALRKAFGLAGLPRDYMIRLALKGTTDNASIDKVKATAKISALAAQTQGPQGVLVGGLLDLVGGGLHEKKAPPPTTDPLPWEEAFREDASTMRSEEINRLIPLKAIEKGASSLFKKLFR